MTHPHGQNRRVVETGGAFRELGLALLLAAAACGGQSERTTTGNPSGGTSGTGPEGPFDGCAADADCRVHSDCCGCVALGPREPSPSCFADCDRPHVCEQLGIRETEARCVAGRCTLDRACASPPRQCPPPAPLPMCPVGFARFFGEDCTTGCLPAIECSHVSSCEVCQSYGMTCVMQMFSGRGSQTFHCVPPPIGCDGTCECMQACIEDGAVCSIRSEPPRVLECYVDCPSC